MRRTFLPLLCLAVSFSLSAQERGKVFMRGRVTDAVTGDPVENVNVFISSTTIGTSTLQDGRFHIAGAPRGMFEIVFSCLGYRRNVITVRTGAGDSLYYEVALQPQVLETGGVEIVEQVPAEWKENLRRFEKAFIGRTPNAGRCRILNPEVMNFRFDGSTGILIATSDSILRVENRATGYLVHIMLDTFAWNVRQDAGGYHIFSKFKELPVLHANERNEWQERRRETFRGSLRHFLTSLAADSGCDEQFILYTGSLKNLSKGFGHRVHPGELLHHDDTVPDFTSLSFKGYIMVEQRGMNPAASFLTLDNQSTSSVIFPIPWRSRFQAPGRKTVSPNCSPWECRSSESGGGRRATAPPSRACRDRTASHRKRIASTLP